MASNSALPRASYRKLAGSQRGTSLNPAAPPRAPGIAYLGIIAAEHEEAARRHRIRYDALRDGEDSEQEDGQ